MDVITIVSIQLLVLLHAAAAVSIFLIGFQAGKKHRDTVVIEDTPDKGGFIDYESPEIKSKLYKAKIPGQNKAAS